MAKWLRVQVGLAVGVGLGCSWDYRNGRRSSWALCVRMWDFVLWFSLYILGFISFWVDGYRDHLYSKVYMKHYGIHFFTGPSAH